jgi:hypothetical protein
MKKLLLLSSLLSFVFANEYIPNQKCKSCHNVIYEEFTKSKHFNSTLSKDKIHKGMWDIHPANGKKSYDKSCASCHNPTNVKDEGISCAYCHRIESVGHGKKQNVANMSNTLRSYYGTREDKSKSPYHQIVTTNDEYKNGNICMSCHSHKQNGNGVTICKTESQNSTKQNCITCHMPQVNGSRADDVKTQTHSFHGFAGLSNSYKMMAKYIDLNAKKEKETLTVTVSNNSPHSLFIHPLRVGVVKISYKDGNKKIKTSQQFLKVFANDNGATLPASATKVAKDTTIKANSKKDYIFENIKATDIKVTLGYYLVNPKMVDKLNLKKDYKSRKFYKLKEINVK